MFDLTQLNDDELRAALFDALVRRFDARSVEDRSITVVNRMPAAYALSRRGNLLTVAQGIGLRLLRGDLKWKSRREPRTFSLERATIQSRLAIMPDRIEGTPEEILDRIVEMFLEWTDVAEEAPPAPPPASQGRPSLQPPEPRQALSDVLKGWPVLSEPAQARPAPPPPPPPPEPPAKPRQASVATVPEAAATSTLRTYQLLFETTLRELARAEAVPTGSRYSLICAGVFVAMTAEAFFNDLGSRVIPSWSQLQRLDPREKAEVLSIELFNTRVDWSIQPFRSVAEALGFRRALAHAHAETLSVEQAPVADRQASEVPRTRRTAWHEHCEIATIQRWGADLRALIEHFSMAHDPSEIAIRAVEPSSAGSPGGAPKRR
jgi:hypothetical protein